jgi:hypothetical protein
VCRELRGNGVEIKHIREDGGFECNHETERRLMELHHIEPDMLRPEEECIEAAYDQQAAKIAYVQKDWNREK